ncbi:unnamed protein product [Hanseniaspora opuntiae]
MKTIKVNRIPFNLLQLQSQRELALKNTTLNTSDFLKKQMNIEKVQMESDMKLEFQKSIKDIVALVNPLQDTEAINEDVQLEQEFLESCEDRDMQGKYGEMHKLLDDLSIDSSFSKYADLSVMERKLIDLWAKNIYTFYGSTQEQEKLEHNSKGTPKRHDLPWFGEFNWTVKSKYPLKSEDKYKELPLLSRMSIEEMKKTPGVVNHYQLTSDRKKYWDNNLQGIDVMSKTVLIIMFSIMGYNSVSDYFYEPSDESL